jgi:hypothetical protein
MAGNREIGVMGSAVAGRGVALLRLDRVTDAISAGEPLTGGGVIISLAKPDWARFAFPGETKAAAGETKAADDRTHARPSQPG